MIQAILGTALAGGRLSHPHEANFEGTQNT
jgi:hypothetical protein